MRVLFILFLSLYSAISIANRLHISSNNREPGDTCPSREMIEMYEFTNVMHDCDKNGKNCLGYLAWTKIPVKDLNDPWIVAASEFPNEQGTLESANNLRMLAQNPLVVDVYGNSFCIYYLYRNYRNVKAIAAIPCIDHIRCDKVRRNFMRDLFEGPIGP